MYIYIYMYIYIHTYTYVYMYIYIYMCMYVFMYVSAGESEPRLPVFTASPSQTAPNTAKNRSKLLQEQNFTFPAVLA